MMMQIALVEGRADFAAPDAVLVRFGGGMEARMEVAYGFGEFEDADGGRKHVIRGTHEVCGGNRVSQRESGGLGQGVDTGVGTAGTGDFDGAAFDIAQDGFECALDGGQTGLDLPAMKVRAIIGDSRAKAARWAFHVAMSAGEASCRPGKPYYTIENSGNNCPHFARLDSQ